MQTAVFCDVCGKELRGNYRSIYTPDKVLDFCYDGTCFEEYQLKSRWEKQYPQATPEQLEAINRARNAVGAYACSGKNANGRRMEDFAIRFRTTVQEMKKYMDHDQTGEK